MRESYASEALAQQALEAALTTLPRKQPLACTPDTPLARALAQMHERRVGSVVVVDGQGAPLGILTRHDVLGRVTLPALPLATPIEAVMSTPLHHLDSSHTLHDAALLMSRHGVRHVPVCEGGRARQHRVGARPVRAAAAVAEAAVDAHPRRARSAVAAARGGDIRRFARNLLGQGVQARQLTELISHLNDVLTASLVQLLAREQRVDLQQACWLAFGSEGRSEQTVATDQDNGLVFASDDPRGRPARAGCASRAPSTRRSTPAATRCARAT